MRDKVQIGMVIPGDQPDVAEDAELFSMRRMFQVKKSIGFLEIEVVVLFFQKWRLVFYWHFEHFLVFSRMDADGSILCWQFWTSCKTFSLSPGYSR